VTQKEEAAIAGPPFVVHVDGEVAADGQAIGLRIMRNQHGPVDICLRTEDVEHMVSVLLALSCEARRLRPPPAIDRPPRGAIPLPLSAINVGQDDHDQTFLMVETGGTALMFAVPRNYLKEVGQTLLTVRMDPASRLNSKMLRPTSIRA
jgi:hypothetical protein